VKDIALGKTDLCIGDFWETKERVAVASFTIGIFYEGLYLIAFEHEGKTSLGESMLCPFAPFTGRVWTCFLAVVVCFGIVRYFDQSIGGDTVLDQVLAAAQSMLGGAVDFLDTCNTKGAKFAMLGFGFFILVTVSTYTAIVINHLQSASTTKISSVEHAIVNRHHKVCAHCPPTPSFLLPYTAQGCPVVSACPSSLPHATTLPSHYYHPHHHHHHLHSP
jgi:hypothetical protein